MQSYNIIYGHSNGVFLHFLCCSDKIYVLTLQMFVCSVLDDFAANNTRFIDVVWYLVILQLCHCYYNIIIILIESGNNYVHIPIQIYRSLMYLQSPL